MVGNIERCAGINQHANTVHVPKRAGGVHRRVTFRVGEVDYCLCGLQESLHAGLPPVDTRARQWRHPILLILIQHRECRLALSAGAAVSSLPL